MQFTDELEHNNKLPFPDVLLTKAENNVNTTVCRKRTNTHIYLN